MNYAYDLHIHSALSPCADDDMTPNNIAGMAAIKGLDLIAVTDHNSCGNVRATIKAAEQYGIKVIPGMELETEEEVHIACYFPDVDTAEKMQEIVYSKMLPIKNDSKTFGNQFYMDECDEITGIEEKLLVSATMISFQEVFEIIEKLNSIAVPAHIDRNSYSVISNLGFMPPDVNIHTVEITRKNLEKWKEDYSQFQILTNSDAHNLGDIAEKENFICINDKEKTKLIEFFVKNFFV